MLFAIAFACLTAAFTMLHFCCAIVASRLIAEIQSTPLGNELRNKAEEMQQGIAKRGFFYGGQVLGFHPMNEGVWVDIFRRMDELPSPQRRRAQTLRLLRRLQLIFWLCGAVLLVTIALQT